MPLSNNDRIYSFYELLPSKNSKKDTFQGLPGLLADSLPDKYGNQIINQIGDVIKRWPDYAEQTNVDSNKKDAINSTLNVF